MSVLIAMIIGGMVGAAASDGFGAVGGAALGWLLLRSVRQQRGIAALEASLKKLEAERPVPAEAGEVAPTPGPIKEPSTSVADQVVDVPAPLPIAEPAKEAAIPPAAGRSSRPAAAPASPGAAPSSSPASPSDFQLFAPAQRWLLGGNTIVKVGVGILFIGLAFLAKFASEHVRVPVEVRLAIIAAAAIALLLLGWRLRHRRPGYAQVLQGGAVAVLYLTLFVAFKLYGVLAVAPVFVLMVVVAALSAALAVLQDAPALAVIGALGGFATPLLVSTGTGNYGALFAYYLVLDLGIAAVAWRRTWRALNLIGFFATFVVGTAWGVLQYRSEHYATSQAFLIAFFLLFIAITLMPVRERGGVEADETRSGAWINGSLLFGLPTIAFALQYGLVRETEYGSAISALVLAGFYVWVATWIRSRPRMALAFEASLAIGTVFLTLVIPFAFDARSTAGAWALEGAGLVWLGFRQHRRISRGFGYVLLFLAGGAMLVARDRFGAPTSLFNPIFFNGVMAAAASLAAAYFVKRFARQPAGVAEMEPRPAPNSGDLAEPLLIAWGTAWLVFAAAVEIDAFVVESMRLAAWLATFSVMALVYTALTVRLSWSRIGVPAMAHAPLHALGVIVTAATLTGPMQNGGWWAWPVALLTHLVVLRHAAPIWGPFPRDAVHATGVLVLAGLGALQGRAVTESWGDSSSAWAWLGWLVGPAALLIWLPRPRSARRWPVSAAPVAYQAAAGAVLTAGLLVWTFIANVASNGSAEPLPHVPLVNPLDIGVGVALLAAWLWMRSDAARPVLAATPRLPVAALVAAGFVWLNAMLARAFYHYAGVPLQLDAWLNSPSVQTAVTLAWTVTSLVVMWVSARRAARGPWMVGATLLAAVVLKLLLVDQAGTGTVTRIISFIGVGVLMLIIGYVAPLPSKEESHEAT
ncbi:MAG: DUF2339 domain-containing protein [Gemmatimonadota bacterium]